MEELRNSSEVNSRIQALTFQEKCQEARQQKLKSQEKPQTQSKVSKQIENETPSQKFEFNQENAHCKICYKYAINGVLCKNQKCSMLFCGKCADDTVKKTNNKCPYCRISPFEHLVSPFTPIINNFELVCQLCHQKYRLQEEYVHNKINCAYFKKAICEFCPESILPEEVAKHIRLRHEDKVDELLQRMCSSPPAIIEPKEVILKNKMYLDKINKTPHLGTSGKFYCGQRLEAPKCNCCNGYCGPSNGENCFQCMRLDIKRLGLKKGQLVNSTGNVCWRKGDEFICGYMIYSEHQSCDVGSPCRPCRNMRINIERYKNLL